MHAQLASSRLCMHSLCHLVHATTLLSRCHLQSSSCMLPAALSLYHYPPVLGQLLALMLGSQWPMASRIEMDTVVLMQLSSQLRQVMRLFHLQHQQEQYRQ